MKEATESRKFPRWAKVLIAVVLAIWLALLITLLFGDKTEISGGGSAHAATIAEPADDGPMSAFSYFGQNDGQWTGPTGYWQQHSIPKKECQWVKNPNYVAGGSKPRYIQYCVTHWLAAWVSFDNTEPGAQIDYGPTPTGYAPRGASSNLQTVPPAMAGVLGGARVICLNGHVKIKNVLHLPIIGDSGTNYWAHMHETVCVNNWGTITYTGPVQVDGDTGTVGDGYGWSYLGADHRDNTRFAPNWWKVKARVRFRQCIKDPFGVLPGCVRFRTRSYILALDWHGILQELFYYAGVNGQWIAPD